MIALSLLLAPAVMTLAATIERRLGPSAAGWVAALPISFTAAVVAVTIDAGAGPASTMALSAAAHVPAQVGFGVVFAGVLLRRGVAVGVAVGIVAYAAGSTLIAAAPSSLAVAVSIPVLALAPRFMAGGRPRPGSTRRRSTTVVAGVAGSVIVGAAVVLTRVTGPEIAGAVAAFPSISTLLAMTVVTHDGPRAGVHVLTGLVRSLPCYLTFCLVVTLAAPAAGLAAVALALLACLATAGITWRRVPVARHNPGDDVGPRARASSLPAPVPGA